VKINNTFILFVILLSQVVLKLWKIKGKKINYDSVAVEGVNVVNLMTNDATSSDKDGAFFFVKKEMF
jgi:hypothetical protein